MHVKLKVKPEVVRLKSYFGVTRVQFLIIFCEFVKFFSYCKLFSLLIVRLCCEFSDIKFLISLGPKKLNLNLFNTQYLPLSFSLV